MNIHLAGDLTTFDAKLKDFAVNRTIQGPAKFSVVCTYVLPQGDDLTIPRQRTGSFPNALRNTGISSFNIFEVNGKLNAAYFKFTDNPEIIALRQPT
ncbi:MAG TPA: hypothetical protein VLH08_03520 [Acidobacteriota bacterium]|nr:hypothetical protein [Acidobacteriota bacterium]